MGDFTGTCHNCRIEAKRFVKHRNGLRRLRSAQCATTYAESCADKDPKPQIEINAPLGHHPCYWR